MLSYVQRFSGFQNPSSGAQRSGSLSDVQRTLAEPGSPSCFSEAAGSCNAAVKGQNKLFMTSVIAVFGYGMSWLVTHIFLALWAAADRIAAAM